MSIIAGIGFIAETLFDYGDPKAADPVDRVSSRTDFAVVGYAPMAWDKKQCIDLGLINAKVDAETVKSLSPVYNVKPNTPPSFASFNAGDIG